MENNKKALKLDDQEMEKVIGGASNEFYGLDAYHNAGIVLNNSWYSIVFKFAFKMSDGSTRHEMDLAEANSYVDFYRSHNHREYIEHVQKIIPDYNCICSVLY